MQDNRYDVIHRKVAQHTGLNLYLLYINFPFDLITGFQLFATQYTSLFKHTHHFRLQVRIILKRHAALAIQPAPFGLFFPLLAISVSVETNRFGFFDIGLQHFKDGSLLTLPLRTQGFHILFEQTQLIGNGRIERQHRRAAIGRRTQRPELETVSGECKR